MKRTEALPATYSLRAASRTYVELTCNGAVHFTLVNYDEFLFPCTSAQFR